ncbi:hypothetical protein SDC9_127882 [bioreactor metagenome]|uniref:Uncharacterized protein n=1 Tax=bioreactor metagenome TaxID=1076179 RepID=A0A645CVA0_9ZZZZ
MFGQVGNLRPCGGGFGLRAGHMEGIGPREDAPSGFNVPPCGGGRDGVQRYDRHREPLGKGFVLAAGPRLSIGPAPGAGGRGPSAGKARADYL